MDYWEEKKRVKETKSSARLWDWKWNENFSRKGQKLKSIIVIRWACQFLFLFMVLSVYEWLFTPCLSVSLNLKMKHLSSFVLFLFDFSQNNNNNNNNKLSNEYTWKWSHLSFNHALILTHHMDVILWYDFFLEHMLLCFIWFFFFSPLFQVFGI